MSYSFNSRESVMKKINQLGFLILFLGIVFSANAEPNKGKLYVEVKGFNSGKGKLIVQIFREQDDIYANKPFQFRQSKIFSKTGHVEFEGLLYGRYSVLAFHDANSNNKMDHNFMKFPIEAFGFSNHWNFSLFSGKPSFAKTSFSFSDDTSKLQIQVR